MTPVTTQAQEARDPLGHAETGTNPAKSYKSCQKFLLGTCGNAMRPAPANMMTFSDYPSASDLI
jgi:hypothetical protein